MAAARGLISRPRNWCGSTVRPSASRRCWASPAAVERIEHLAFEALQVFERDVEEIAGAAGRVEHAHLAQAVMESVDLGPRGIELAFVGEQQRGGLDVAPVARAAAR